MAVFDFKKEHKDLYLPKKTPSLVDVPKMTFIMVDGEGDPNGSVQFQDAVELLYGLSYTIKMSYKKGKQPPGYYEYVVPPLEGLWWVSDGRFLFESRDNWRWTVMIRQPDFVAQEFFSWACAELQKKKKEAAVEIARLESYAEGLCVQAMHIGPYATEPETVGKMDEFLRSNGYRDTLDRGGKHHEIYLSDPRKAKEENMKTVLRHPAEKAV